MAINVYNVFITRLFGWGHLLNQTKRQTLDIDRLKVWRTHCFPRTEIPVCNTCIHKDVSVHICFPFRRKVSHFQSRVRVYSGSTPRRRATKHCNRFLIFPCHVVENIRIITAMCLGKVKAVLELDSSPIVECWNCDISVSFGCRRRKDGNVLVVNV